MKLPVGMAEVIDRGKDSPSSNYLSRARSPNNSTSAGDASVKAIVNTNYFDARRHNGNSPRRRVLDESAPNAHISGDTVDEKPTGKLRAGCAKIFLFPAFA